MQEPYSYHIFLFPFRWKNKKSTNPEDLGKLLNQDIWEIKPFDVLYEKKDGHLDYNEYVYFHNFVRDAIYFKDKDKKDKDKRILRTYGLKDEFNSPKYIISHYRKGEDDNLIKENDKIKTFKYYLDIEKIELKIYETGVGILAFFLKNTNENQKDLKHILAINEFGRRTYTPFYTEGFDIEKTKEELLAHKITVKFSEDIQFSHTFGDKKKKEEIVPEYILKLLGVKFSNWNTEKNDNNSENIKIRTALDDRMFVISWYGNTDLINKLKTIDPKSNDYNYLNSEDWYKYIFIDTGDANCRNQKMKHKHLEDHSYARFIGWGILYGMSRYSFVCLTSDLETLKKNKAEFIPIHLKTMYYQLVVLSLMQRASILRFSDEITEISTLDDNDKDNDKDKDDQQLKKIKDLNKAYLKFTNEMYFREVTAQEQGIELYDMLQQHMRIERNVKDLNREINELYQFARLLEDEKDRKQMNKLQLWGSILLIPTVIASFLGMNTISGNYLGILGKEFDWNFLLSVGIIVVITAIIVFVMSKYKKKKSRKHTKSK